MYEKKIYSLHKLGNKYYFIDICIYLLHNSKVRCYYRAFYKYDIITSAIEICKYIIEIVNIKYLLSLLYIHVNSKYFD